MSESHEPSYYEIALTNRQVLIAFVMLLGSVLVAFLCGVWVGRDGGLLRAGGPPLAGDKPEVEQLADLEELHFFSDGERQPRPIEKPDLSRLAAEPKPQTTLAEDLGASSPSSSPPKAEPEAEPETFDEPPPLAVPSSPPSSPPATIAPARPAAPVVSDPAPARPPAATARVAEEGFIIQVFSTRDEPQALRVLGQLKNAGYKAFLSSIAGDGSVMHRVRIGPFSDRARAEATARKVNEQFKLDTWITAASN